jgi:hypothetical protein
MPAIGNEIIVDVAQLGPEDGDFLAARPQRVLRDGASVTVPAGEPMPEVWSLPTHKQRSLLRNRDVVFRFGSRAINARGNDVGRRLLASAGKGLLETVARDLGVDAGAGSKDELVAALTKAAGWEG